MNVMCRSEDSGRDRGRGALDERLPAYLVVDERHHIHRARGRLNRRDHAPRLAGWLDAPSTVGDLLGCINTVVERLPCGETSRCRFCALQQLVRSMGADDETDARREVVPGEATGVRPAPWNGVFERTCVVDGRPVTRRLLVSARQMHGTRRDPDARRRMLVSLREAPAEAS